MCNIRENYGKNKEIRSILLGGGSAAAASLGGGPGPYGPGPRVQGADGPRANFGALGLKSSGKRIKIGPWALL